MFSSLRDSVRERLRLSKPGLSTLLTAGVVGSLGVLLLLAGPGHGSADSPADVVGVTVALQQVVDLRCLTRRSEDCLDEPVPADEPHGAVCATCHNLYDNRDDPREVRACTDGGCHADPESVSPFHETLVPEMLQDCSHCHVAHTFRAPPDGQACSACHLGGGDQVAWAGGRLLNDMPFPEVAFVHDDHTQVTCATCHGVGYAHTTLKIRTTDDCRSCHHGARARSGCAACHEQAAVNAVEIHVSRELGIDIGSVQRPVRWLRFEHGKHEETPCQVCHTEGTALATGPGADCSTCHANHHAPSADCSACHARPSADAHGVGAHLGCGGTGCHTAPEGVRDAPRTRSLCLVCHRDRADHHTGETCSSCHVLPEPRHGGAGPTS